MPRLPCYLEVVASHPFNVNCLTQTADPFNSNEVVLFSVPFCSCFTFFGSHFSVFFLLPHSHLLIARDLSTHQQLRDRFCFSWSPLSDTPPSCLALLLMCRCLRKTHLPPSLLSSCWSHNSGNRSNDEGRTMPTVILWPRRRPSAGRRWVLTSPRVTQLLCDWLELQPARP